MRPIDLLQLLWQQPFRPFRLQLSTGAGYEVRHPEQMAVGVSSLTLDYPNDQYPYLIERREVIIALNHIVALEVLPPTVAPSSN